MEYWDNGTWVNHPPIHSDINHSNGRYSRPHIKYGVNSTGNLDPVPAKAENHYFRNSGFPRFKYPVSSTGQAKVSSVTPRMINDIKLMSSCPSFQESTVPSFQMID